MFRMMTVLLRVTLAMTAFTKVVVPQMIGMITCRTEARNIPLRMMGREDGMTFALMGFPIILTLTASNEDMNVVVLRIMTGMITAATGQASAIRTRE
jgi:hypothetical protein